MVPTPNDATDGSGSTRFGGANRRRFLRAVGVASVGSLSTGAAAVPAAAADCDSDAVDEDCYHIEDGEDRAAVSLSIDGPTDPGVSGIEYGISWEVRVDNDEESPYNNPTDLSVYLESMTFQPTDGTTDYGIEEVYLKQADDGSDYDSEVFQYAVEATYSLVSGLLGVPTIPIPGGASTTDTITRADDTFTVQDPNGKLGCSLQMDLGTESGDLDHGDTFEMEAVLDGTVARTGGYPGEVIDEFSLTAGTTITYAGY